MDRKVRIRRRRKPRLVAVYHGIQDPTLDLDKVEPNYYCTRIWVAVVPPEDVRGEAVPGYACVVAEKYDGDPMQKERQKVVLDEGIAIDPENFTPRERLYFGMRPDVMQHPTLYTLRDAAIGLKDLYWAERVLVPPGNPQFFAFFQSTDGLYDYDSRYGDARYHRQMPFFVSRRRTCDGVFRVEHEERAHNLELVNSLLEMDKLSIMSDLQLFWERRLPTAYRAIGMACAEMQLHDMTYQIRQMHFTDGYDDYEPKEEELERRELVNQEVEDISWWATGYERVAGGWLA